MFQNFLVSKSIRDKRVGLVSRFPVKLFCLTKPKKLEYDPLYFINVLVSKNFKD